MVEQHSVTIWLAGVKDGDDAAAAKVWQRFHLQLVAKAAQRLKSSPVRTADADDVVQEAFQSFFRRAQDGQFPQLKDRDELWSLLLTVTERKALNRIRSAVAQKRGGGQVHGESIFQIGADDVQAGMDRVAGCEPTPDDVAMVMESCDRLLMLLNAEQRLIAVYKLEGRTNDEIARLLDCAVATVERRLQLIRRKWSEAPDES